VTEHPTHTPEDDHADREDPSHRVRIGDAAADPAEGEPVPTGLPPEHRETAERDQETG
jgi:hypothetical protein